MSAPPSNIDEGTNGADSCIELGDGVQCIWNANGTWVLPAGYTNPGDWVVVQGLGGPGGAGFPVEQNPGGAPGRAQATLPADSLAGETLYLYVGENGLDEANFPCNDGVIKSCAFASSGGAASMMTTTVVPDTFVADGCNSRPEGLGALVISGAGVREQSF